jgi:hypothetical protein
MAREPAVALLPRTGRFCQRQVKEASLGLSARADGLAMNARIGPSGIPGPALGARVETHIYPLTASRARIPVQALSLFIWRPNELRPVIDGSCQVIVFQPTTRLDDEPNSTFQPPSRA